MMFLRKPATFVLSEYPLYGLTLLFYFIVGFSLFLPHINNPFIMDDELQILGNEPIHDLNNIPSFFSSSTMSSGGGQKMSGIYFKPLMTTYYSLIWSASPNNPSAYRLPLLFLFIFSAFFVFYLSTQFLSFSSAFLLGLVFLIHPANSEIIYYIADAQDVLYFFFGVLSLVILYKAENEKLSLIGVSLCLTASLLSKETGALFLILLPLAAFLFKPKKFKFSVITSALIALVYGFWRWKIGLTVTHSPGLLFHQITYWDRLSMVPSILSHYLTLFLWPTKLSTSTDFIVTDFSWSTLYFPIIQIFLFLGFLVILYKRAQYKSNYYIFYLAVGILWFALHGNFIVALDGVYADRWFYMGIWALLCLCFIAFEKQAKIIALIAIAPFMYKTYLRGQEWSQPLLFYQAEHRTHPNDPVQCNNVGVELFRQQRQAESGEYFLKSLNLNPTYDVAWNNLGAYYEFLQMIPQALEAYKKSTEIGLYTLAYENYAKLLYNTQKIEEAKAFAEKSLQHFPNNSILQQISNLK